MIKSVVAEREVVKKNEYPCIKKSISGQVIVLFTELNIGAVINIGTGENYLGQHRTDWREENFEPFNGTVTLSNEE